jgi:hypothetical protein
MCLPRREETLVAHRKTRLNVLGRELPVTRVTASAAPLCPACHSDSAAWEIDSPVRALDRAILDMGGIRLLGLGVPDGGLEPVDRPEIRCAECRAPATEGTLRDQVLAAATAATRGEPPRLDA